MGLFASVVEGRAFSERGFRGVEPLVVVDERGGRRVLRV